MKKKQVQNEKINHKHSPWEYDQNDHIVMSIKDLPSHLEKARAKKRAILDEFGFYDVEPVV